MGLSGFGAVKQVIVVPRNGYINRLQAMASAAILSDSIGADFRVCWESDSVAPATYEALFNLSSFPPGTFINSHEVEEILGCSLSEFPRYVTGLLVPRVGQIVTLAGHDRGEQPLIDELARVVGDTSPVTLIIAAGGRFSLDVGSQPVTWDSPEFQVNRAKWYQKILFAPEIESQCSNSFRQPSIGLHLRYSDRSHQAPSRREISTAVLKLVESTGIKRVFIASDSLTERARWLEKLRGLGLDAWSYVSDTPSGSTNSLDLAAMIDWRFLSRTSGSVFFSESSFGHEAAVASNCFQSSVSLNPNPFVGLRVRLETLMAQGARRFSR
jgi:hypothetical protein